MLNIFILSLLLFGDCEAKGRMHPREECFVEGACINSYLIEERSTANANACHDFCKTVPECQWFTFHLDLLLCLALANCNELNTVNYTNAISGQSTCEQFQCGIQGRCQGNLVHVDSAHLQQGCLDICLEWNNNSPPPERRCEWFTYNEGDKGCFLFSDCPTIDEECLTCVSGQSKCGPSKVMTKLLVGSGMPLDASGTHFEIIDLSQPQTQKNCTLSKFPYDIFAAVGAVIPPSAGGSQGSPLICGGFSNDDSVPVYEKSCHQLPRDSSQTNWSTTDGWEQTTDMGESGRQFAAATTLMDNGLINDHVWWVTGGLTNSERVLKTTVIRYLNGTWGAGPLMENPVYSHCILQVVRHKTVVIGGIIPNDGTFSNISNVMKSFDWDSKTWSLEASLQTGRHGHACGLLRDPEAGNGEFPSKIIVAGGLGVDVDPARKKPLSSVEIYDSSTKTWSAGPELPQPLFGAVMIQYGLDEVLLLGGGNYGIVYDTIWSISSTNMVWRQLDHRMSTPRYGHVAFLVPDNVLTPPCQLDLLDESELIEEIVDDLTETSETTLSSS